MLCLLFSLGSLSWRRFHVTPREFYHAFFLQLCNISHSGKMDVSLYDRSPVDRCLGCFQYFAITNKAAVDHFIFSVDSSDEFPGRMDGQRELIYDFDRCWQIALPWGCAHFTPVRCIWSRDPCQQFITPLKSSVVLICFPYYEWCSVYSHCINSLSYFHFMKYLFTSFMPFALFLSFILNNF